MNINQRGRSPNRSNASNQWKAVLLNINETILNLIGEMAFLLNINLAMLTLLGNFPNAKAWIMNF